MILFYLTFIIGDFFSCINGVNGVNHGVNGPPPLNDDIHIDLTLTNNCNVKNCQECLLDFNDICGKCNDGYNVYFTRSSKTKCISKQYIYLLDFDESDDNLDNNFIVSGFNNYYTYKTETIVLDLTDVNIIIDNNNNTNNTINTITIPDTIEYTIKSALKTDNSYGGIRLKKYLDDNTTIKSFQIGFKFKIGEYDNSNQCQQDHTMFWIDPLHIRFNGMKALEIILRKDKNVYTVPPSTTSNNNNSNNNQEGVEYYYYIKFDYDDPTGYVSKKIILPYFIFNEWNTFELVYTKQNIIFYYNYEKILDEVNEITPNAYKMLEIYKKERKEFIKYGVELYNINVDYHIYNNDINEIEGSGDIFTLQYMIDTIDDEIKQIETSFDDGIHNIELFYMLGVVNCIKKFEIDSAYFINLDSDDNDNDE